MTFQLVFGIPCEICIDLDSSLILSSCEIENLGLLLLVQISAWLEEERGEKPSLVAL